MKRYAQAFKRINFHYIPPWHEIVVVIFETDSDEEDEEFTDTMWEALWQQWPQWRPINLGRQDKNIAFSKVHPWTSWSSALILDSCIRCD